MSRVTVRNSSAATCTTTTWREMRVYKVYSTTGVLATPLYDNSPIFLSILSLLFLLKTYLPPLSPSPFIISTQQMSHHTISWISCQCLKSCQSVGTPHTVCIVFIGHYLFVLIDSLFQHSFCSGGIGNHDRPCFLHVLQAELLLPLLSVVNQTPVDGGSDRFVWRNGHCGSTAAAAAAAATTAAAAAAATAAAANTSLLKKRTQYLLNLVRVVLFAWLLELRFSFSISLFELCRIPFERPSSQLCSISNKLWLDRFQLLIKRSNQSFVRHKIKLCCATLHCLLQSCDLSRSHLTLCCHQNEDSLFTE